jgi:hypothetical protein
MAIHQHGLTRLVWNQIDDGLWQAGGLGHSFSIIKAEDGTFSMREKVGDDPSKRNGNFSSLKQAQFRAQRIIDEAS